MCQEPTLLLTMMRARLTHIFGSGLLVCNHAWQPSIPTYVAPTSLSLSLHKVISRKTQTHTQTAIRSKPCGFCTLYMHTNLCVTRDVRFRGHFVERVGLYPQIARLVTHAITLPTEGISCITPYPFSLFGLQVSLGNSTCLARQANPFLTRSAQAFVILHASKGIVSSGLSCLQCFGTGSRNQSQRTGMPHFLSLEFVVSSITV